MTASKRGFIFDLDGTLVDTMPSHFVAWTEIAQRHGFEFPEARFYALGGVPTAKIAAMLIEEAGLTLDPVAVAMEKEEVYYAALGDGAGLKAIAPVLEMARRHRAEGPLAIASGSVRRLVTRSLATLGITDWFAAIVAAEDTARHKPPPPTTPPPPFFGSPPAASAPTRPPAPSTKTPTSASRRRAARG